MISGTSTRAFTCWCVVIGLVSAPNTSASPNVGLDDARYDEVERLRALDVLHVSFGGFLPLTEVRLARLLRRGSEARAARGRAARFWIAALRRIVLHTVFVRDAPRSYSTALRDRAVAGSIAVSCEREESRPCGAGAGLVASIDTALGFGDWISAAIQLRANGGSALRDEQVALDRAYVNAELGPFAAEVGRDVVAFGPSRRTQLSWGTNAPAFDHVRVSTSEPFALTSTLRASAHILVGRLRAPQRFPGNLVSIVHAQLDISKTIEVGVIQLLQLGGEGAPHIEVWDFIAEHVRRRDLTASETDSSNRRFGGDFGMRLAELYGARLYYAIMFEDIRRARFIDAVRYDADHLLGVELSAIGPGRQHGLTIEWHRTGFRSQEHSPRTTGFTNAGFVVGSPLGPDATSLFTGGRIELFSATLYPWLELAALSSDTYQLVVDGPINPVSRGSTETRYRLGTRMRIPIQTGLWAEGEGFFEHVDTFAFEAGVTRNNAGISASIVWHPGGPLGRLSN